jgi:hypothetical protein
MQRSRVCQNRDPGHAARGLAASVRRGPFRVRRRGLQRQQRKRQEEKLFHGKLIVAPVSMRLLPDPLQPLPALVKLLG